MLEILLGAILIIGLIIGSYHDIRTREVPDWLSYFLIATGLGIRAIYAITETQPSIFFTGLLGFALTFLLAVLLFYTGQWGGGDAKLIMGVGAIVGVEVSADTFLVGFLINLIIIGALYGFIYSLYLINKHRAAYKKAWKKYPGHKHTYAVWTVALLPLLVAFAFKSFFIVLIAYAALIVLSYYLLMMMKVVEEVCMIKTIPVSKLTEGEWIVEDVVVRGKRICGPRDLGITDEQIALLKKYKVKHITIKEGIPFVPSFLLAYILTLIVGNWFVQLLFEVVR